MKEIFRPRRHRIELLRKVESANSFGEVILEWLHFATIWAEIHPGNIITTRYLRDVEPGWRVRIGAVVLDITAVVDRHAKKARLVELHIDSGTGEHAPCATAMNSKG
jgi:head-tail adaptor